MKKINCFIKSFCVFIFLVCLELTFCFEVLFIDNLSRKYASSLDENNTYAKALSDCTLYKSQEMVDDIESIYFQVPETYFVMILETINDKCLKVKYDRFVGFVNVSRIEKVSFVPIVKFLSDVTFDIKSNSGTQVWKLPLAGSEICTMIPAGTKKINYIASVKGVVPSNGESNLWFYVSYTPDYDSTSVYEGYVYSENTTNLTEIISNKETNPVNISDEFERNINNKLSKYKCKIVAEGDWDDGYYILKILK